MKRIVLQTLIYTSATWTICYLASFIFDNFWFYIGAAVLCVGVPIGTFINVYQGNRKAAALQKLGVDFARSIPCYLYSQRLRLKDGTAETIDSKHKVTYGICLCTPETFHFYECDYALMLNTKYTYKMCDFVNEPILIIPKNSIELVDWHDVKDYSQDRSDDIAKEAFKVEDRTRVHIDALVDVVFVDNGEINVLRFGIPDRIASNLEYSVSDFLPGGVGTAFDVVTGGAELLSYDKNDQEHIRLAKLTVQKLKVELKLAKEEPSDV